MRVQGLWRKEFAEERQRVQKMKDEFASVHGMKASDAKDARMQQLEEVPFPLVFFLFVQLNTFF
jgi:hypothetical protein